METKKINFGNIPVSQEGSLMLVYFAFLQFNQVYQQAKKEGKTIEDMKITYNEEPKVTEQGFRQFLHTISSLDYDENYLTDQEKDTLNDIILYLQKPVEGEAEPIVKGEPTTLKNLINNLKN